VHLTTATFSVQRSALGCDKHAHALGAPRRSVWTFLLCSTCVRVTSTTHTSPTKVRADAINQNDPNCANVPGRRGWTAALSNSVHFDAALNPRCACLQPARWSPQQPRRRSSPIRHERESSDDESRFRILPHRCAAKDTARAPRGITERVYFSSTILRRDRRQSVRVGMVLSGDECMPLLSLWSAHMAVVHALQAQQRRFPCAHCCMQCAGHRLCENNRCVEAQTRSRDRDEPVIHADVVASKNQRIDSVASLLMIMMN
jgi:hypothetical protein